MQQETDKGREQKTDRDLTERFLGCFDTLIKRHAYSNHVFQDSGRGWHCERGLHTDRLDIVPLWKDLVEQKGQVEKGNITVQQFYNQYIGLFDSKFDKFLGLSKPETVWELLITFNNLLYKEAIKRDCQYQLIKSGHEIAGIFYLYDYHPSGKRATLGIGVAKKYRKVGLANKVITSYMEQFMGDENPETLRLTAVVEDDNIGSLQLFKGLGFNHCHSASNYYGDGNSVSVYTYLAESQCENR